MLKTYNFWIKLVAVLIVVFKVIGDRFGFYINSELFMDIGSILASILVVLGVIQVPPAGEKLSSLKENKEVKKDIVEVIKEMDEKLKGITEVENSAKLSAITMLMDEIVAENAEVMGEQGAVDDLNENLESESAQVETQVEIIEGDTIVSEETTEGLDEYLIQSGEVVIGSNEEVIEEEVITLDENKVQEDETEALVIKLKEKVKKLVEDNIDSIVDELAYGN